MLSTALKNNVQWAAEQDAAFFEAMESGQSPKILWLGCSDSRAPPNTICGLPPGEIFVHRNIANVCVPSDINFLSVLEYAVLHLKVESIVVCGHYGCGGVNAALGHACAGGVIDNWLCNIRSVAHSHRKRLAAIEDPVQRSNLLAELNVASSVFAIAHSPIVQAAWARGQNLSVNGWVFRLSDGRLEDLGIAVQGPEEDPEFKLVEK
ncbi:carbonic anhydrase [Catenaria anguillulae PL171]|uniref:Carbonic anhydrase n=1 Tax=Catenaria anguillulae PL171 TaxID=765915 RepID=A0A1Y2HE49_9FUNG|nr:carbonic anhydrase [Catenaria anguillulae PL171]